MRVSNTSNRLKKLMNERNLKQIDILRLTVPYCEKFGVKMNKSDISQYVSGKVEPNQNKLFVLGNALNVNEAWLMGYDVPKERSIESESFDRHITVDTIAFEITERSLQYSPIMFDAICKNVKDIISLDSNATYSDGQESVSGLYELLINPNISYADKAFALNYLIDIILYDTENHTVTFMYDMDENETKNNWVKLDNIIKRLNDKGLEKVIDYASDLSSMPMYKNNNTVSNIVPLVAAAHERTDIKITEEMRKHDDDIMDSDDF